MKKIRCFFVSTTIILFCLISVNAQSEKSLQDYFEFHWAVMKINMPATKDGVDVYVARNPPIDDKKYAARIREFGVSIKNGERKMITKIKVKGQNIELHLGRGGYGKFGDEQPSDSFILAQKSKREKKLEEKLDKETDAEQRKEINKDLKKARNSRDYEDDRRRDDAQSNANIVRTKIDRERLFYGSRFNIHFDHKITAQDLTPQVILDALADYIEYK